MEKLRLLRFDEGMGSLSTSEYAPKHTCLPPAGHAIKCFIFVLFRGEKSTASALG
jgi:hypothetical protein